MSARIPESTLPDPWPDCDDVLPCWPASRVANDRGLIPTIPIDSLRNRCKVLVGRLLDRRDDVRPVPGWYECPFLGRTEHWWAVTDAGEIVDPSALQFPSGGRARYVPAAPWDLVCQWRDCDNLVTVERLFHIGPACSDDCYGRIVGVL